MARSAILSKLSIAQLHAEVLRREKVARTLIRLRKSLRARIAKLDSQIAKDKVSAFGPQKRARPKNDVPLIKVLKAVIKAKTSGVSEVIEAVSLLAGPETPLVGFRSVLASVA